MNSLRISNFGSFSNRAGLKMFLSLKSHCQKRYKFCSGSLIWRTQFLQKKSQQLWGQQTIFTQLFRH